MPGSGRKGHYLIHPSPHVKPKLMFSLSISLLLTLHVHVPFPPSPLPPSLPLSSLPARLHFAIQAYKELLLYVQQMSSSKDTTLHDGAKVIHSNIFYHPEYRDVFVTLLRNYYEVFQTRSCLRDLIEATHVYVRQMERYSSENSHMIVQERRTEKGRGRKKKKGQGTVLYSLYVPFPRSPPLHS